jgi:hypothetical protein
MVGRGTPFHFEHAAGLLASWRALSAHPPVSCRAAQGIRGGVRMPGGATGPTEVIKSVLDTDRTGAKEEIFVDIVEKLTAIFDASGHQKSSSIVGAIQVRGKNWWRRGRRGCGRLGAACWLTRQCHIC